MLCCGYLIECKEAFETGKDNSDTQWRKTRGRTVIIRIVTGTMNWEMAVMDKGPEAEGLVDEK